MFGSTHIIRRLAGLAVVAGAFAALAPIAQADSGFQGEHDAVDPVLAVDRARQFPTFDGREWARLEAIPYARKLAVRDAQLYATFDGRESARLEHAPDVIERAAFQGEHDAVDQVSALQRAQQAAVYDGRESARLMPAPDVIERTAIALRSDARQDLSAMPDVIDRTIAAGQLQYTYQPAAPSGFDWDDFGIGAGAGIGLMLLLLGLGASVWVMRQGERQVSNA